MRNMTVRPTFAAFAISASLLAAVAVLAADAKKPKPDDNPYAPRKDLSPKELREFIEHLQDAPTALHERPGFAQGMREAARANSGTPSPTRNCGDSPCWPNSKPCTNWRSMRKKMPTKTSPPSPSSFKTTKTRRSPSRPNSICSSSVCSRPTISSPSSCRSCWPR